MTSRCCRSSGDDGSLLLALLAGVSCFLGVPPFRAGRNAAFSELSETSLELDRMSPSIWIKSSGSFRACSVDEEVYSLPGRT